jgi:hypothetical protein
VSGTIYFLWHTGQPAATDDGTDNGADNGGQRNRYRKS